MWTIQHAVAQAAAHSAYQVDTVGFGSAAMTIEIIPGDGRYPGRTMLRLTDTRAIVCIGVGPAIEQAVREKAAEVEKEGRG